MNIVPAYQDGMAVARGRHRIWVERSGYEAYDQWVDVNQAEQVVMVDLQKSAPPAPPATPARPGLLANTPNGGSVVGSYAIQENAYDIRNLYQSQNVRAEVERIMVNNRPIYQVRVWR